MTSYRGNCNVLVPEIKYLTPLNVDIFYYPQIVSYTIFSLVNTFITDPLSITFAKLPAVVNNFFFWYSAPALIGIFGWLPTKSVNTLPASLTSDVLNIDAQFSQQDQVKQQIDLRSINISNSQLYFTDFGADYPISTKEVFSIAKMFTTETITSMLISGIFVTLIYVHFSFLYKSAKGYLTNLPIPKCEVDIDIDSDFYFEELFHLDKGDKEILSTYEEEKCDDDEKEYHGEEEEEEAPNKIHPHSILSLYRSQIIQKTCPGFHQTRDSSTNMSFNKTSAMSKGSGGQLSDEKEGADADEIDIDSVISDTVNIDTHHFKEFFNTEDTEYSRFDKMGNPEILHSSLKSSEKDSKTVNTGADSWNIDRSIKASLNYGNHGILSYYNSASNTTSWRFVNLNRKALSHRDRGFVNRCTITGKANPKQSNELISLFDQEDNCD